MINNYKSVRETLETSKQSGNCHFEWVSGLLPKFLESWDSERVMKYVVLRNTTLEWDISISLQIFEDLLFEARIRKILVHEDLVNSFWEWFLRIYEIKLCWINQLRRSFEYVAFIFLDVLVFLICVLNFYITAGTISGKSRLTRHSYRNKTKNSEMDGYNMRMLNVRTVQGRNGRSNLNGRVRQHKIASTSAHFDAQKKIYVQNCSSFGIRSRWWKKPHRVHIHNVAHAWTILLGSWARTKQYGRISSNTPVTYRPKDKSILRPLPTEIPRNRRIPDPKIHQMARAHIWIWFLNKGN